jgi:uncharacterized protein DUF5615
MGFDVLTTQEAGRSNQRLSDDTQLEFAASLGRAILTYNAIDFEPMAREWGALGKRHAGIIVTNASKPIADICSGIAELEHSYPEGIRDYCLRV